MWHSQWKPTPSGVGAQASACAKNKLLTPCHPGGTRLLCRRTYVLSFSSGIYHVVQPPQLCLNNEMEQGHSLVRTLAVDLAGIR